MTLPKHLRPRWRYLAVGLRSWPDTPLSRDQFASSMQQAARRLCGDTGAARMGLELLTFTYDRGSGEAIVRTRRGTTSEARAALGCVTSIDHAPIGIHVRGVSGSVRGCEEKYLGRQPEALTESTVVFQGAERSAVRRGNTVDVRVADAFVGATPLDLE